MLTQGKITEHVKVDVGVEPISLATTNDTGGYHPMSGYKKAIFVFTAAAMAKTKTVVAQIMEATNAAAGSAAALASAAATITANTIVDATSTVTLTATMPDGTTSVQLYVCEDTTPDIDAGEFASGANDTAACVELAAVINNMQGDYILATASGATVILTAAQPGDAVITITLEDSTIVASTLEAIGYVEIDAAQLTATFTHIALKLTTDATIVVGATLLRASKSRGKANPGQMVAAGTVL
jgi:hypothetical protein